MILPMSSGLGILLNGGSSGWGGNSIHHCSRRGETPCCRYIGEFCVCGKYEQFAYVLLVGDV